MPYCTLAAIAAQVALLCCRARGLAGETWLLAGPACLVVLLLIGTPLAPGASYLAAWPLLFTSVAVLVHERMGTGNQVGRIVLVAGLLGPCFVVLTPMLHRLVGLASVSPWVARAAASLLSSFGVCLLWTLLIPAVIDQRRATRCCWKPRPSTQCRTLSSS